jgi:hypothetical protein
MKTLGWGLALFAAVAGFLAGTNNVSIVSTALLGIMGAVATLLGIAEKINIDKFTAKPVDALAGSAPYSLDAHRSIAETWKSTRATLNEGLATSLGSLLLCITVGFLAGFGMAIMFADTPVSHIAEPWRSSKAPADLDAAIGWLAVADKLQKAGYSQRQIERVYEALKDMGMPDPTKKREIDLGVAGRSWLGVTTPPGAAGATKTGS